MVIEGSASDRHHRFPCLLRDFELLQVVVESLFMMTLEVRPVGMNRGALKNLNLLETVQRHPFGDDQFLDVFAGEERHHDGGRDIEQREFRVYVPVARSGLLKFPSQGRPE